MSEKKYIIDHRPAKGRWAPGDYSQTCFTCGTSFLGDKRASECAACAYQDHQEIYKFGWAVWNYVKSLGEDVSEEVVEEIYPMAEKLGLCISVLYDPEIHGDMDAMPGEDYVWQWIELKEEEVEDE